MCSCERGLSVYSTRHTTICNTCGYEKTVPYDLTQQHFDWTKTPVMTCYSRKKRFAKLFDATIAPHGEPNDTQMLKYLSSKNKAGSVDQLLQMVKRSSLRDKRYGSLHLLAKLFLQGYYTPAPPENLWAVRRKILYRFEDFEFAHKRYRTDNFFNYRWLLAKLLTECGLERFLIYVKLLKCPIRCQHYEEMFAALQDKLKYSPSRIMI